MTDSTARPDATPTTPPAAPRRRRVMSALAVAALTLVVAFGLAEAAGWPFLAGPAERLMSQRLHRDVQLRSGPGPDAGFRLHLLGGISLAVDRLQISNARWSNLGPMIDARNVSLDMRWRDLIGAGSGQVLHIDRLAAVQLDVQLERLSDGRASWHFVAPSPLAQDSEDGFLGLQLGDVSVAAGTWRLDDGLALAQLKGRFHTEGDDQSQDRSWVAEASGRYRGAPLKASLHAGSSLTEAALGDGSQGVPLVLAIDAGQSQLKFEGQARDVFRDARLNGRYQLAGPSLATVGTALGVTLPTTAAFKMNGELQREGSRWVTTVQQATIGRSELSGQFVLDRPAQGLPRLSGELKGRALWLQDLGPAIGAGPQDPPLDTDHRVLPQRSLDLPSLSAMQADVKVRLDRLELGHPKLSAMQPVVAHLLLEDGVLRIEDLDARLAAGRVSGNIRLDGRAPRAVWDLKLAAQSLKVEQWIEQPRDAGQPPYVAGRLAGQVSLHGQGRSVAELLSNADGRAWLVLSRGQVSHLAVEAAGLDLAQWLGVQLKGDDALTVSCGAADLTIEQGVVEPRVLVLDTADSTVWAEGALSLADEELELVAHVEPKDFSLLSLRSPLKVHGPLAAPQVRIDKGSVLKRLVPSALLAMVNPLAALLPLVDTGDDTAGPAIEACRAVVATRGRTPSV
jgi:AsmA family protein